MQEFEIWEKYQKLQYKIKFVKYRDKSATIAMFNKSTKCANR